MFPFVSFLRTLLLQLLHLEPTNGRVNVWRLVCISRELQRQCNPASQPNKTCCDEPSSYFPLTLSLSCSLPTLSLFSVFFCLSKQTDASVLMMSCFRPQASMAEAWHSHAIHHCPLYTPQTTKSFSSTCMLQTNSCRLFNMRVRALLFFRWRTLQTFACASLNRRYGTGEKHTQWQPRSRGALSFRATRGVLALSVALLTSLWLPEIELTF